MARYKTLEAMKSAVADYMTPLATQGSLTVKLTRSDGYQCRLNGRIVSEVAAKQYLEQAQVAA